jgi:hypothetical protein
MGTCDPYVGTAKETLDQTKIASRPLHVRTATVFS